MQHAGIVKPESSRVATRLYRFRHLIASVLAVIMYVGNSADAEVPNDWIYFAWGSDTLFGAEQDLSIEGVPVAVGGGGGLHLYANHAFLQIGPPALLLAKAVGLLPFTGVLVAGAMITLLGLLTVWLVDGAYRPTSPRARFSITIGLAFVTVLWSTLVLFMHLDDALALASIAGAVLAIRRQHCLSGGLLLGLAAATKPWAVIAAVLVLAVPCTRQRVQAALALAGVVVLSWGPFVVADPGTLTVGVHHLAAMPSSSLRAIGLAEAAGTVWLRPVQLSVALMVAAALALRGHWAHGLLAGLAIRLLLDPNDYTYYVAGLAVAALIADVAAADLRLPVFCPLVTGFWLVGLALPAGSTAGLLNATCYGSVLLLAVLRSTKSRQGALPSGAYTDEPGAVTAAAPS